MLKRLRSDLRGLMGIHTFSLNVLRCSWQLCVLLYVFAIAAQFFAPYTPDYFYAITLSRGAFEVAPATLGAGVAAALISDLVLRKKTKDE